MHALAEPRPGVKARVKARESDWELGQAKAEAARLGEALKQMAVKLMLIEGRDGCGVCPEKNVVAAKKIVSTDRAVPVMEVDPPGRAGRRRTQTAEVPCRSGTG